jgi:hypothetical protein
MRKQPDKLKNTEARAFIELAKNLLAVPKKEVDEKRAQYERQKVEEKGKRTK